MVLALVVSLLLATITGAAAGTLTVRRDGLGDFQAIQPAIEAAAVGDTIDIGPGEYTEYQTVRPYGWGWDIEIYAYIMKDDITLIGAGPDLTIIGPIEPEIDGYHFTPAGIWAGTLNAVTVKNLTVRNCYVGINTIADSTNAEACSFEYVAQGIIVFGSEIEVSACTFYGWAGGSNAVINDTEVSRSTVHDSQFYSCRLYYSGVEEFSIENCRFQGGIGGVGMFGGSIGMITRCVFRDQTNGSIELSGSTTRCTASELEIVGGPAAIRVERGAFVGNALSIRETTLGAIWIAEATQFVINDSDILPSHGSAVICTESGFAPVRTYDLTGNYWGVADSTAIAALIVDRYDSVDIHDIVDFTPFASGLTATDQATWGAVKSLFR